MRVSDGDIVNMFLERNEDAIQIVSDRYGSRLRSIAFRITGNMQTSEEWLNRMMIGSAMRRSIRFSMSRGKSNSD